jgi:hypothetical protein
MISFWDLARGPVVRGGGLFLGGGEEVVEVEEAEKAEEAEEEGKGKDGRME